MSRTIRIPVEPVKPAKAHSVKARPDPDTAALLASVAGEEDPGAAVDAPAPPPRRPVGERGDGSPAARKPEPGPAGRIG